MDSFKFCFKGNRNYIQGGDIYNAVESYINGHFPKPVQQIDFAIHHFSSHDMLVQVFDADQPAIQSTAPVVCRLLADGKQKFIYLSDTDRPVSCRNEYDEESIIKPSRIDIPGKSITVENRTAYTPIEICIALNKLLMQKLFPDEKGKWIFTRLMLKKTLPESSLLPFALTMTKNIGTRITSSTVTIGGDFYGDILFSLMKGTP